MVLPTLDDELDSFRRRQGIQTAALRPPVHAALWNKFGSKLPGDAAIRAFLTIDLKFLPDGADQLIKEYKETFVFAHLDTPLPGADNSVPKEAQLQDESGNVIATYQAPPSPEKAASPMTPTLTQQTGIKQDAFAVARGHVTVSWPESLGELDIADIEAYWPILLRKIKRSLQADKPPEPPANSN